MTARTYFLPAVFLALAALAPAAPLPAAPAPADARPRRLYEMSGPEAEADLKAMHAAEPELGPRVVLVSEGFLGARYALDPLGEGTSAAFDRGPLLDLGSFDCTTFVETVMALALEPDLAAAGRVLQRIRYEGGAVVYERRNHFAELDWIPNNLAAGFVEDITAGVAGAQARLASKVIGKRGWYAEKSTASLQGFEAEPLSARLDRLERLRRLGEGFEDREVSIAYLPLDAAIRRMAAIPAGTIASFVREPMASRPVMVTHQGFIMAKGSGRFLRHASSSGRVKDEPLAEYLRGLRSAKWRVLGLNLLRVRRPQ